MLELRKVQVLPRHLQQNKKYQYGVLTEIAYFKSYQGPYYWLISNMLRAQLNGFMFI